MAPLGEANRWKHLALTNIVSEAKARTTFLPLALNTQQFE
jgi:hypothetical protein